MGPAGVAVSRDGGAARRTRCPRGRRAPPRTPALTDVDPGGTEAEQPLHLLLLVAAGGMDVQVDAVLHRLALGHAEEEQPEVTTGHPPSWRCAAPARAGRRILAGVAGEVPAPKGRCDRTSMWRKVWVWEQGPRRAAGRRPPPATDAGRRPEPATLHARTRAFNIRRVDVVAVGNDHEAAGWRQAGARQLSPYSSSPPRSRQRGLGGCQGEAARVVTAGIEATLPAPGGKVRAGRPVGDRRAQAEVAGAHRQRPEARTQRDVQARGGERASRRLRWCQHLHTSYGPPAATDQSIAACRLCPVTRTLNLTILPRRRVPGARPDTIRAAMERPVAGG
jgi:hypothetical protein